MIFQGIDFIDLISETTVILKSSRVEAAKIFQSDSDIHEDLIIKLFPSLHNRKITFKKLNDILKNGKGEDRNEAAAQLYILSKRELEKLSFNELCKIIKNKNGYVDDLVFERAILLCYHDFSEKIIKAHARKKGIKYIDSDDIETIKTTIFFSSKKFDRTIPPHDYNAFINRIVENRLNTMIRARIRYNTIDDKMVKETTEKMESNIYGEDDVVTDIVDAELLKIATKEESEVIKNMIEQYKVDDPRQRDMAKTMRAMLTLNHECRSIFIQIMRYTLKNIEYSTKRLMKDLNIDKSEDAMRQSLRMCRKRLSSAMDL